MRDGRADFHRRGRRARRERQVHCSVALGVKKRVLRALLWRRARSVLPRERTAPIVCDVDVRRPRIWNDVEPERRRQAPTLHPASLRVLCVMDAPTFTAEDAERAEKDRF